MISLKEAYFFYLVLFRLINKHNIDFYSLLTNKHTNLAYLLRAIYKEESEKDFLIKITEKYDINIEFDFMFRSFFDYVDRLMEKLDTYSLISMMVSGGRTYFIIVDTISDRGMAEIIKDQYEIDEKDIDYFVEILLRVFIELRRDSVCACE
jgi:hypothetical protein